MLAEISFGGNMGEKEYLAVGIRLLGIYYFIHFFTKSFIGVAGFFSWSQYLQNDSSIDLPLLAMIGSEIVFIIIYLLIFYPFIFKADRIANFIIGKSSSAEKIVLSSNRKPLKIAPWLLLIGVYFFITFSPDLIEAWARSNTVGADPNFKPTLYGQIIGFFLSILLIFRCQKLEKWFSAQSQKSDHEIE